MPTLTVVASAEDLADLARLELANAALLAIARGRDLLAGQIGASGLKSVGAAMAGAADLLARCGSDLDAFASNGVASLTITEMTATDVERIQAEVETAFHSEDMGSGDDDDLTDEQHASSALA